MTHIMRSAIALSVFAAALAAAPQDKHAAAAAPAPSAAAVGRTIPAGAVEREDGRFFYTDQDGKKWIYVRTPFGIARTADPGTADSAARKAADPMANVKVTESGDTVTFERPGPFGTFRWQKKAANLDEQERAALNRSRAATAPTAKAADPSAKQER